MNVEKAVKLAKAVKSSSRRVELAEVKSVEDTIDPERLSLEEEMETCVESSGRMLKLDSSLKKITSIAYISMDKIFVPSEGTETQQYQTITLANVYAQTVKGSVSEYYYRTIGGVGNFLELIT